MRVRTHAVYTYQPVGMDLADQPYGVKAGLLEPGDRVKVVNLPGCPPPNTMGHCHVADADTDRFLGLVNTNSLSKE